MSQLLHGVVRYVAENRTKLLKFVAVTGGSVIGGQALLAIMLYGFDWPYLQSNMISAGIMVMPNYLANRYWVWGKRSKNSFKTEVVPFWVLAILGFLFSTLAVWFVQSQGWAKWVAMLANLVSYGIVWVFKFFVLERFLFGKNLDDDTPTGEKELVEAL